MGKKREKRKSGPLGLPAGLLEDIDQAERERITPEELARLLEQHRAGDDDARRRLQHGLRWIAYQYYMDVRPTVRLAAEDVLGILFEEFGDCIKRLRENTVKAEGVEGYIRGDLMHSITHYMGECSQRINPKESTNCERKKRGLKPYKGLARKPATYQREDGEGSGDEPEIIDHLGDPTPRRIVTPTGEVYQPSKYEDDDPGYYGRLWQVTKSPLEEEIVDYLWSGTEVKDIAQAIGISQRRVKKIRERLEARVLA